MAVEIMLVKQANGSYRPCTQTDSEISNKYKVNDAVKFVATKQRPRSLKHHQKYWAGLIALTFDYWEPEYGLLGATEISTLKKFANFLESKTGKKGAIDKACKSFLTELRASRSGKHEVPTKTKEMLHEWIKLESGWCEYHVTPRGIRKAPKSINFNAMDQDEFNQFYKSAFTVCWNYILSRTFENESEAENAINILLNEM